METSVSINNFEHQCGSPTGLHLHMSAGLHSWEQVITVLNLSTLQRLFIVAPFGFVYAGGWVPPHRACLKGMQQGKT